MIEVAIHTKHQHLQAVLADRGVLLRCVGEKWQQVAPPSNGLAGPWIEFIPHVDGVRVRTSKDLIVRLPERVTEKSVLNLPLQFDLDQTKIEIVNAITVRNTNSSLLESLDDYESVTTQNSPSEKTLSRWFEALSTLNHWKIDKTEFLQAATELVVEPLGFDAAYLVALDESHAQLNWQVVASHLPRPKLGVWLDTKPLDQLLVEPKVYFQPTSKDAQLACQKSAIAFAPWFRKDGSVLGAIIGVRHLHSQNSRNGIRPLEAKLLQLLADSINQEQARQEQLEHCDRRRKLLEQAFSPALATRIEQDPQVLNGCRRDVTVLFADLRDSSSLFQNEASTTIGLSPLQTYQVLSDVMDALTAAVIQHEGLIIDYYGDGLAAMWNAPFDQPNHIADACQAAIEMQLKLRPVSERWRALLNRPLLLGVGIHTGSAQVGNIGSQWKLKYGARGSAVNIASRLEQATKQLETPIVVTGEIARRLPCEFQVDRLCRALVAGIDEGIDLFRLENRLGIDCQKSHNDDFDSSAYAEALSLFEAGLHEEALQVTAACDHQRGPMAFITKQIQAAIESRPGRRRRDVVVEPRDRVISFS